MLFQFRCFNIDLFITHVLLLLLTLPAQAFDNFDPA